MAAEILILDPTSENAANVPLTLTSGSYGLTEHRYPQPAIDPQWASSSSTEGAALASQRYQNREIAVTVEVDCTTNLTPLRTLQAKLTKLAREGGTLQRTMSDATVIVFDVLTCDGYDPSFDQTWHLGTITTVSFTLQCKPFGRGPEQDLGDNVETTLPVLVFTEASIPGDIPAEGRLVVDNDATADQWWLTWGVQSRYYSSATTAALYYEAEGRTPLGGAATAVGTTGASGAGSNVVKHTSLSGSFQGILSTQTTAAGAHLTHIGTYRVYTRVLVPATNTGTVTLALQWGEGDYLQTTQNADVALDSSLEGSWLIADMGVVTLSVVTQGSQRWEGRWLAKSTVAGDDVEIDCFWLIPADEGSGIVASVVRNFVPTTFSSRDEFDQTAGALTGKTMPVGGTWAGAGSANDFSVSGSGTITRAAVSDTPDVGRFVVAPPSLTASAVSVDWSQASAPTASGQLRAGVLARYTDTNNYVVAYRSHLYPSQNPALIVVKKVAGTFGLLRQLFNAPQVAGLTFTMQLQVTASGTWILFVNGAYVMSGSHPDLATGGTLASGKVGIYDENPATANPTRTYDNFWAAAPSFDAAVFASQSAEIRSDGIIREDSTGTIWQAASSYQGDLLRVPPSGAEARTARVIVKGSRNAPGTGPDTGIDDISARLFVKPRYLNVPS